MPTPKFGLAKSAAEARKIAEDIGTNDLVVKAQVKLALFDLSLTFAFSRFLLEVVEEVTLSTIPRAAYNWCTALRRWKILYLLPFLAFLFLIFLYRPGGRVRRGHGRRLPDHEADRSRGQDLQLCDGD